MIAIKGTKIPKSCSQCNLCVEDKYADMTCVLLCEEWEENDYNENHRDERCPLVEIVTCKDCKHCCHITDAPKVLLCEKHNCQQVSKNFYCADGERKE